MLIKNRRRILSSFLLYCLPTILLSSCYFKKCRATALIFHVASESSVVESLNNSESFIERIESESFIQEFIERQEKPLIVKDFKKNLRVKLVTGTNVIEISYFNSKETDGKEIVNAFVDWIYRDYVTNWQKERDKDNPSVIRKASLIFQKMRQIENKIGRTSEAEKQKLVNEWNEYAVELRSLYSSEKYLEEYNASVIPIQISPPLQIIQTAESACPN